MRPWHAVSLAGISCWTGLFACGGEDEPGGLRATGGSADAVGGGGQQAFTGGTSSGGAQNSSGGAPAIGGSADSGGTASGGMSAGAGGQGDGCATIEPLPQVPALDCGPQGVVFVDSGRPENRINYVIVGDGYTADQLEGLYVDHITNMLEHDAGMFGQKGEPYVRYRNYINICALKVESQEGCVDDRDTGLECDTAFDGYGDDASRLGIVDDGLVLSTIGDLLPNSIDVDWVGVTINAGADNWWNSGGAVMVWNGGFEPQESAASVALHEGGHAFHGLADEYAGTDTNCGSALEPNVSTDDTGAKWSEWLGFDHDPGTGLHGVHEGARYCDKGVYRPTFNSEMNQLPDFFNMPSMQKMVHDIYEVVDPIDAHTDNYRRLTNPAAVQVRLVDPDVVRLVWSIDAVEVPDATSECLALDGLEPGEHQVEAHVRDETPWVRDHREDLEQTVSWSVLVEAR